MFLLTYMPHEIFNNTFRRHPELNTVELKVLGAVKKLIFALSFLCWANKLLTFCVNCGLKQAVLVCFAQPTPTLQHPHPSCHSPRAKCLQLH